MIYKNVQDRRDWKKNKYTNILCIYYKLDFYNICFMCVCVRARVCRVNV